MGAKQFVINALADYNLVFTLAEAMKFRAIYLRTYPGVALWQQKTAIRCLLRSRPKWPYSTVQQSQRGYCQRLKPPIQGRGGWNESGAHPPTPAIASAGCSTGLCIHDEVCRGTNDRAEEVKAVVEKAMIEAWILHYRCSHRGWKLASAQVGRNLRVKGFDWAHICRERRIEFITSPNRVLMQME